jgi:putative endonuclease
MFERLKRLLGLTRHTQTGERGERIAAEWLQRERHFTIVARNWRSPRDRRDEIDLVGRDGEALVFIEVKTRAVGALVPGYYAVDDRKKAVVRRTAGAYLRGLREKPRTVRFDIVEIEWRAADAPGAPAVRHFENIPLFSKNFRA